MVCGQNAVQSISISGLAQTGGARERNTTPVYHLLPAELCSLTLCADARILGEIPTGVGFLSLKPGRWVHATRGERRDMVLQEKTGGDAR